MQHKKRSPIGPQLTEPFCTSPNLDYTVSSSSSFSFFLPYSPLRSSTSICLLRYIKTCTKSKQDNKALPFAEPFMRKSTRLTVDNRRCLAYIRRPHVPIYIRNIGGIRSISIEWLEGILALERISYGLRSDVPMRHYWVMYKLLILSLLFVHLLRRLQTFCYMWVDAFAEFSRRHTRA